MIVVDNSPGDGAAEIVRSADPAAPQRHPKSGQPRLRGRRQPGRCGRRCRCRAADEPRCAGHRRELCLYVAVYSAPSPRRRGTGHAPAESRRNDAAQPHHRTPAVRPISEDVALTERFPNWQRPRRYRSHPLGHQRHSRRVDAATGACLFLRRAALADVGPFDERFFVDYEETDWLIRAKRRGWQTVFLPTVEATQRVGRQLAARSLTTVAAAPGIASLRPEALRRGHGGAPANRARRDRQRPPRPPRARGQLPTPPRRGPRRPHIRVHLTLRAPRPS